MIEVNLLGQKKAFKMPVVLGVDLGKLNLKMLMIVWLLSFLPDLLVYSSWEEQVKAIEVEIAKANNELKKVRKDLRGNKQIKDQLEAFNRQVERLKKRSSQVDSIIKLRTNPRKVLEKLARSTPDDLWFTNLKITRAKRIEIEGESNSYKSIGNFIVAANDSPFFGKTLTLSDSKTKEADAVEKSRVESFRIIGTVETFDPFK